ncbi:MAG: hypothetical protein Q4G33_09275 [bacterium]|nr:hypothetical protein [bacterium]
MIRPDCTAERELVRVTPYGNDYVEICTTEKTVKNLREFYDTCRRIAIAQIERGVLSEEDAAEMFKTPDELDALGYHRIDL